MTALDLSEDMLIKAKRAADRDRLAIRFDLGDAEHLPYESASFEIVSSCFGVIFAPAAETAARELARVCRQNGRLGLTSWAANPAVAALFEPYAAERPVDASRWEDETSVRELLGQDFELDVQRGEWIVEASSGEEVWELWTTAVPPIKSLLKTLEPERKGKLHRDFVGFYEERREGDVVRERRPFLRILGTRR